jgi:hypothetical protein
MAPESEGSDDFSLCAAVQGCPVYFTGTSKLFRHLLICKGKELDNQYSENSVMHILFNLIQGLYIFRALLAHPQEVLYKQHLVY